MDDERTQVLNFSAKMQSRYPEDLRRKFVVSFYLYDKTIAVFEMEVPNSGFRAGKFLQRTRLRDPVTNQFFDASSFYVGAKIHVSGRVFELIDAAPHTFNLMEANPDDFPEANITLIVEKLTTICQQSTKSIRALFEEYDKRKTGIVSVDEAKSIFNSFVPQITPHAAITLTRAFDQDNGTYDYNLLLNYMRA
ncbi:EF-hand domain-containing family member C2 isoform X1 [Histomonas meleagridis]|uniref:EF-hand domain-containing family member C2 isoform X1 n=1 Tax=Histomonas meleagridis TaxID=135588 RepID=UPI003559E933|nr:EF-hand domain-containing family member C2 isoform X1 [Histomonas meleagridis]KAH0800186.1 EF-hand domain-containing family member C2 isoform X1 [Histomonas meleagridis]